LLQDRDYDLILCDIQLEGESGWDLMERLPKPINAIAVSALGTPANIETSLRAGFVTHIVKPFKMAELDRQIQEVLHQD
jgi:CheY-like chemotaxis protein